MLFLAIFLHLLKCHRGFQLPKQQHHRFEMLLCLGVANLEQFEHPLRQALILTQLSIEQAGYRNKHETRTLSLTPLFVFFYHFYLY